MKYLIYFYEESKPAFRRKSGSWLGEMRKQVVLYQPGSQAIQE